MTDEQRKVTRTFRLFSEKPRMVVFNTADDEPHPERFTRWPGRARSLGRSRRAGVGAGADEPGRPRRVRGGDGRGRPRIATT